MRFAIFIRDAESVEEFVGLARIDTEADDEQAARDRAVMLYQEFSGGGRPLTDSDIALSARLAEESRVDPTRPRRPPGSGVGGRAWDRAREAVDEEEGRARRGEWEA